MSCPRCGSARVQEKVLVYADGPMPATRCLECGYLDLLRLPTYVSPKTTGKVDQIRRRLPDGGVLPMTSQAGVMDDESVGLERPSLPAERS